MSSTAKPSAEHAARSAYVGERISVLQAELKALTAEKREIATQLKAMTERNTPEAKKLKARRAYVSFRPGEAKTELAALTAERRALAEARKAKS
jgi:cell division protein FtsB